MLKQYRFMRSWFMRSPGLRRTLALTAALVGGGAASPAVAQPTQYLLGTSSGGCYCDGLLLTQHGRVYKGTHNSPTNSCTEGDQAGGFSATGYGTGAGFAPGTQLITVTTEDPNGGSGYEIVFNLDLTHMLWNVWVDNNGSGPFAPVNSGVLGCPMAAKAGQLTPQTVGGVARDRPALNRPAIFR
jgi:hypothetical protein